jgi:DNA-binding response OmpR family regulator
VLCKGIRVQSDTPLIVLSRSAEENDIIQGLELGADDYIIKPFSPRLMVARIKALLRRTGSLEAGASTLMVADLVLDCSRRRIRRSNELVTTLTRQECRLLEILIRNTGHMLPSETLINHVWGASRGDRLMLKKLVSRLRRKLAADPLQAVRVETIAGVGYRLVAMMPVSEP